MSDRGDGWIQTYGGRRYWPLEPRPHDVEIEDIAHHLAMLCRFTGACRRFYSVAEHSVKVSYVAAVAFGNNRPLLLRALMHDAAEAYCNDIARPVKRKIVGYGEIEAANEAAIFDRFGIPLLDDHADVAIKHADNAMLVAEQAAIMAPCAHRWVPENVPGKMQLAAHGNIGDEEWGWRKAKAMFLLRYDQLTV